MMEQQQPRPPKLREQFRAHGAAAKDQKSAEHQTK